MTTSQATLATPALFPFPSTEQDVSAAVSTAEVNDTGVGDTEVLGDAKDQRKDVAEGEIVVSYWHKLAIATINYG